MLSVTYFYREPRKTGMSIEGIFSLVKNCLKKDVEIREFYCKPGISRFKNAMLAMSFAGEINHITGDVNFLAIGLRDKKNILTVHDVGHYETLRKRNKLLSTVYKFFWFQLPLRNIAIITVVSEFTQNNLINFLDIPKERIRIIPNPIKPIFQFSPRLRISVQPRILQIGSGRHKNLLNLIRAAKGTNYHLDIIAYLTEEDKALLAEYSVSYIEYHNLSDEEVYEKYKECDVLFFASFYEGFGMPIIEAQAVGRPVITSNIGAMKEVAKDSAILVDPTNVQQIKDALQKLLSDNTAYERYVNVGLQNTLPYHYDQIAAQYLELYKELAAKK